MNKKIIRTAAAAILAAVTTVSVISGCRAPKGDDPAPVNTDALAPTSAPLEMPTAAPTDKQSFDGTMVVMRSKHADMTLYDFGQQFYNGQNLMSYLYGMMSADQYVDSVVEELSTFMRALNAAIDGGTELTAEEEAELDAEYETQLDELIDRYAEGVGEEVEDKRAAAIEQLNKDLAEDNLDFEQFAELANNNMRNYRIVGKFYQKIIDDAEATDDQILEYISKQTDAIKDLSMSEFNSQYMQYCSGQGAYPPYFPKDCFSVDHIYLGLDTETAEDGSETVLPDSRKNDEAAVEEKIAFAADYEAFMALIDEYGEDPGMKEGGFKENGYLIHPDVAGDYYDGFVYAAMKLYDDEWAPEPQPEATEQPAVPEVEIFTLLDGTRVGKFKSEYGVHYMIVCKVYKEGEVAYEKGDDHWMTWESSVKTAHIQESYDSLLEEWKQAYPIDVDIETIKAKYVPAEK